MSQMVDEDFSELCSYHAYELRSHIEFFLYLDQPIDQYLDESDLKMVKALTKLYEANHERE